MDAARFGIARGLYHDSSFDSGYVSGPQEPDALEVEWMKMSMEDDERSRVRVQRMWVR